MPSFAKQLMMREIEKEFEASPYAFVAHFEGLDVAALSDLRQKLNKAGKRSMLVKHTLAKKIFAAKRVADAEKLLKGSVLMTFAAGEPQVVSKAIVDFAKANEKFVPDGVIFENKAYDAAYVKQLANLPSRQELLTQLVVRVKSPITGFVLTLNQVLQGFVTALNEIKKLKETQGRTA